jgi:hypothetical protein
MNLILAGSDILAMDKLCTEIMGIDWADIGYLKFIDQHYNPEDTETQIIGEDIEKVKRPFRLPYLDAAVRAQRWVYKSNILTRLCFGTPFLNMLQGCLNVYRKVDEEIKGKEWVNKHWDNSLPR